MQPRKYRWSRWFGLLKTRGHRVIKTVLTVYEEWIGFFVSGKRIGVSASLRVAMALDGSIWLCDVPGAVVG